MTAPASYSSWTWGQFFCPPSQSQLMKTFLKLLLAVSVASALVGCNDEAPPMTDKQAEAIKNKPAPATDWKGPSPDSQQKMAQEIQKYNEERAKQPPAQFKSGN